MVCFFTHLFLDSHHLLLSRLSSHQREKVHMLISVILITSISADLVPLPSRHLSQGVPRTPVPRAEIIYLPGGGGTLFLKEFLKDAARCQGRQDKWHRSVGVPALSHINYTKSCHIFRQNRGEGTTSALASLCVLLLLESLRNWQRFAVKHIVSVCR